MAGILGPTALSEKTWGIILSETNKNVVWPDEKVLEQKNCDVKLELSQATLGSACKVGERTVVEMQIILDDESETPETFTLVSLREGVSEHVPLNISLRPPVSFKLVSGSGPVTLLGIQQDFGDSDDSDSEDDGGLKIPPFKSGELPTGSLPSRKRLQESPEEKTQKKSKTAIKDDLADDENISIKKKVLLNKASFPEIKAEKNLTKDSDDDDFDDDDDSMDDDDDDLDDSDINGNADELADSDLADSPQIQPPKKISEKKGKFDKKSPNKKPDSGKQDKMDKQQKQKGKKGDSFKSQPQAPLSMEALKAKLRAAKGLPKTESKFTNYIKGWKVDNESQIKELWNFAQTLKK